MTWKNVKLIFLRELRDQLRDRRTLFMVAVLPLLLYPALGVGMTSMTVNFSELERTVAIIGAADLPPPPLLDPKQPDRFLAEYFDVASDVDKLRVITESTLQLPLEPGIPDELQERQRAFVKQAFESRACSSSSELCRDHGERPRTGPCGSPIWAPRKKPSTTPALSRPVRSRHRRQNSAAESTSGSCNRPSKSWSSFRLDSLSRSKRPTASSPTARTASPATHFPSRSSCRTVLTRSPRLPRAASRTPCPGGRNACVKPRLEQAGLPSSLSSPVDPTSIELAAKEDLSANLWSKLFPALLVMMGVTGAFYPAIDLGAGEKERGTMETLLISPARRSKSSWASS